MPRSIEKCVQGAFLLSTTNNLADTFSVAHVSALALSGMTSHPDVNSIKDPRWGIAAAPPYLATSARRREDMEA